MDENQISKQIVDAAIKVHSALGPGLFESVYEQVLCRELESRNLSVERQAPVSIRYDGMTFDDAFRADLIVNGKVIVEIKSVEHLLAVHNKQLLTYLKLSGIKLGLLINFGTSHLKDGIERLINGKIELT